ncbi:uncharacterized protein LOC125891731 isoform X2 [Epinephelus fuscoguttatus]|uniref:uncharacterized protein LOC125891731 isoform X2 n=1 Tax=Epinephelus fuscoguttatus TaxID=293821 RepID=UPI0020D0D350|nr:uncharacterized protein LOC125891731 isoform X2 [Epinephelus fuscoguttatus]
MRSKLIYVLMMAVMSALLVITNSAELETTWGWTTPGTSVMNLNGKMFTLSRYRGGISFYPPYYSATPTSPYYTPKRTTRPYYPKPTTAPTTRPTPKPTTHRYYPKPTPRPTTKPTPRPTAKPTLRPTPRPTTKRHYPTTYPYPWTTAPPTRGVTVCLRYLADDTSFSLLTISPSSRNPLNLDVSNAGYQLTFQYGYNSLYLRPNIRFWSNPGADIWTRVCLTLDSMKNVAQVFSGSHMSIRKLMPVKYAWSGQPVIELSGFDGQMTDLQVWDYPLRYREVFNYMTGGVYMPYSGSVITWSYIGYTPRGSILMEDVYEQQARQPISSSTKEGGEGRKKGYRPKEEKKTMKLYYMQSKSENNF